MFDNINYMGVNAPKEHQRIIGKLMSWLGRLYYHENKIKYEPFPETMVDDGQTSPTPDMLLFDHEHEKNVAIIEVSTNVGAKKDFIKVMGLMKDYDIQEGFVYNYTLKTWRKYDLGKGEIKNNPSFCEALGLDLNLFV